MITLSSALQDILDQNLILKFGVRNGLFNLSQLARLLLPQLKARTKKELTPSSILMALSRLQRSYPRSESNLGDLEFAVDSINVTAGLSAYSFSNTFEVNRGINNLYNKIQKRGGFMTITHGLREIRVIIDRLQHNILREHIPERALAQHNHLASLSVTFKKNYLNTPGFFFVFFQQLYFQNVNIIEIASTANELIIYVEEKDSKLAFDTLYNGFLLKRR